MYSYINVCIHTKMITEKYGCCHFKDTHVENIAE